MNNLFKSITSSSRNLAVSSASASYGYDDLFLRVARIGHKLESCGLKPNSKVVVNIDDDFIVWFFALSLLSKSCGLLISYNLNYLDPAFEYDFIISTDPKVPQSDRLIKVTNEWLSSTRDYSSAITFEGDQQNASVYVQTSGTTGSRKTVCLSIDTLLNRAVANIKRNDCLKQLCLMPLSSAGGLGRAFANLLLGQTNYFYNTEEDLLSLLKDNNFEVIFGSPHQVYSLAKLIQSHGGLNRKIPYIHYAGGAASPELIQFWLDHLCQQVKNVYGSTEAGGVAAKMVDIHQSTSSVGSLYDDVQVEIVDDKDQIIINGQVGIIRIKTPTMVQSYHNNLDSTKAVFSNGWFYPGDLGKISNGELYIIGRSSEMMNVGGVKVNPVEIENFIQSLPGIKDAAVIQSGKMNMELACVIVVAQRLDIDNVGAAVLEKFGLSRCPVKWYEVSSIPRNDMGKINRIEIVNHLKNQK